MPDIHRVSWAGSMATGLTAAGAVAVYVPVKNPVWKIGIMLVAFLVGYLVVWTPYLRFAGRAHTPSEPDLVFPQEMYEQWAAMLQLEKLALTRETLLGSQPVLVESLTNLTTMRDSHQLSKETYRALCDQEMRSTIALIKKQRQRS